MSNLPVGGCPLGPYVLSERLIPLFSCAVNEPKSPTAAFCDRLAHSSDTFSPEIKARFPFKRNRLRCVRCVNENRKKRKRLRFLRFSFTHWRHCTQRKRLRLNGNRA